MPEVPGFDADVASCGQEALELERAAGYDLILMDCQMPELDGFDAATAIRARETRDATGRRPIIALTADVQKGIREQFPACRHGRLPGQALQPG